MTVKDLLDQGGWKMPPDGPSKPYRRHERGLLRADKKPGFTTPSGKVEVYCETYKSLGSRSAAVLHRASAERRLDARSCSRSIRWS